ncbi:hypothetical protein COT72_01720 [archaeon CG10_big_fil_rev_8_21_14_0_10_43_11]|nr:MAG: hypothetical protein COT72_01720 [archaeon CG10_big_fil_rev_8_21_14_0_10_43_11]
MKRGQIQILTEFLGFAVGIVVVIAVTYLFSQYLGPLVINEAMDFHLKNVVKQIQTSASSIEYYANVFEDKTITLRIDLPSRINRYSYEVFVDGNMLCASVPGTLYEACENNTQDIRGVFISGSRMNLKIERFDASWLVTMSST